MYRNEGAYKEALSIRLKAQGFSVQAIESPGTGSGIPDRYISSKACDFRAWMELKNFKIGNSTRVKIPYRPGQFAWLMEYSHNGTFCILGCATEYGEVYFYNDEIKEEYDADVFIHWPRLRTIQ